MAVDCVRLATLNDVRQMAEVFASGFMDDEVFGKFMHPKRRKFPDDWLASWTRDFHTHLLDPVSQCYVRTNSDGHVAGCMILRGIGKGGDARAAAETYWHQIQRRLYTVQKNVESMAWPDRSADDEAVAAFDRNWEDIKHHFTGPRAQCWMIELFCIHPDSQKKGYGRDLVQTAIDLCKSETPKLPLCVIASDIGDAFYEKYGFREVGRANVGALAGVVGGSLKFFEDHLE